MFLGLVVSGCATPSLDSTHQISQRRVIETVFENFEKSYAISVPIRDIAIAGLKGLSGTDTLLFIQEERGSITLRKEDRVLKNWREPLTNDHKLWARLTSEALRLAQAESEKMRDAKGERVLKNFFEAGFAKLDPYTRYNSADDARNTRARREGFGGLGITIRQEQGKTFVSEVHEGTPAFGEGVSAGDQITHIGGTLLKGLSREAVIRKLRGPTHSRAELTILRGTNLSPLRITVIRAHIILPTVKLTLEDRILNIAVSGFNRGTSRRLEEILLTAARNTRKIKGIILDLRGNPGGLLEQAVAVADYFLNDGRIISTHGRNKQANQVFGASLGDRANNLPIVVLVNGLSASASEIVAAALHDRSRAVIVGSSSYGKGSVQTIIQLPNRGELTLTWAHVITPSGLNLQDHGVIPRICTSGPRTSPSPLVDAGKNSSAYGDHGLKGIRESLYPVPNYPANSRELCPPSNLKRTEDIEIARYLLNNRKIYSQAIHSDPSQPQSAENIWMLDRN